MKRRSRKQSNNNIIPLILIGIGVLLVIGVLVWQAVQSGGSTNTGANNGAVGASGEENYPEIKRVTLFQSKTAFDNREAVFLDVRDSGSFQAGHIPGSINIPVSQIEAGNADLSQLQKDQWIITYCT